VSIVARRGGAATRRRGAPGCAAGPAYDVEAAGGGGVNGIGGGETGDGGAGGGGAGAEGA